MPPFRHKNCLPQALLSYTRCSAFNNNKKITRHTKRQEKHPEKKQSLGLTLAITQILELSDREFKINMINTLKALQEKVDNMHDQVGNVNKNGKKNHVAVL